MAKREPTISLYRQLLNEGHATVRGMLRRTPDDANMRDGVESYRRIIAMLDSMTVEEEAAPFEVIDADSIRRIAASAATTDQEVIALLCDYRRFCEQILKLPPDTRPES